MDETAEMLIGIGSQGTAGLAILQQLLHTLIKKDVLRRVEVVATLELAAEAVERQPDKLGGMYSRSTGATIRQMRETFVDGPESGQKH